MTVRKKGRTSKLKKSEKKLEVLNKHADIDNKLQCQKPLNALLSPERLKEVDAWIAKYPSDQKQSAVMSTLRIVQEQFDYISPELVDAVAAYLDMPTIAVYEVLTFYTMYEQEQPGRHVINVCTNISCKLAGCSKIVERFEQTLKIKVGETTSDGRFTLRTVECLAACANAPVVQIDKNYHENLTGASIGKLLERYS